MKQYFKEGQTVYHAEHGVGKITKMLNNDHYLFPLIVTFYNCTRSFTYDGREYDSEDITLSQNPIPKIKNTPLVEKYIPFEPSDVENIVGKLIRSKLSKNILLITGYDVKDQVFFVGNTIQNFGELFDYCEFLDGSPCGKLK